MALGYIYIMTNKALKDMVKIGYATDVESRRKQLSTTALPYDYEVYATYETSGNLEDKKLHRLIDNLNPDLRVSRNREFFVMSPEDAFELLEAIATISGTKNKLRRVGVSDKTSEDKKNIEQKEKNKPINFIKCGIPIGAELVFIEDDSVRPIVVSDRKVSYHDELTSLSNIVGAIKGWKSVQGSRFFTYNGELLIDIAARTQWKQS
jgi:hypothetical protein